MRSSSHSIAPPDRLTPFRGSGRLREAERGEGADSEERTAPSPFAAIAALPSPPCEGEGKVARPFITPPGTAW
jgi:hypothetical protein